MTTLLHLSDPHFGTERPAVLDALHASIGRIDPDLVVLSGDITQRATAAQFAAAGAFLTSLGPRARLVIPGNHDIPLVDLLTRFRAPYARYQQVFGDVLEPTLSTPDWLVIGVNSTRRWRHKHGQVSASQIAAVAERLRRATPQQCRVVVVHHPVAVPRPEDARDRLRGADDAIRVWSDAGADLMLSGHIHLPCCLALHERDPALRRRSWGVLAGTALSSRIRDEADNSFNVVRRDADPQVALVERWDYQGPERGFEPVGIEPLALDRRAT